MPNCEAERNRAREILNRRFHLRADGFGTHPDYIDEIVNELFPTDQESAELAWADYPDYDAGERGDE